MRTPALPYRASLLALLLVGLGLAGADEVTAPARLTRSPRCPINCPTDGAAASDVPGHPGPSPPRTTPPGSSRPSSVARSGRSTAANQGKFTDYCNGLDDNDMPLPPGEVWCPKASSCLPRSGALDGRYHSLIPKLAVGAGGLVVPQPGAGTASSRGSSVTSFGKHRRRLRRPQRRGGLLRELHRERLQPVPGGPEQARQLRPGPGQVLVRRHGRRHLDCLRRGDGRGGYCEIGADRPLPLPRGPAALRQRPDLHHRRASTLLDGPHHQHVRLEGPGLGQTVPLCHAAEEQPDRTFSTGWTGARLAQTAVNGPPVSHARPHGARQAASWPCTATRPVSGR